MAGLVLWRRAAAQCVELRASWSSGRRVAVTLEGADKTRVEGVVSHVSATDATVTIRGMTVPLDMVLAVHWPSRLGDGDGGAHGAGNRVVQLDGQLELDLGGL